MSGSATSDHVHQVNLTTFKSFRKTIDELYRKPYTILGDHASLVRRLQEWRKVVANITSWVADDRAYYQQARPEIVNLLQATFDSVYAVEQARNARGESNWIRVNDKEFENLLFDYIKLMEVAFPPHRQNTYCTPADQESLGEGRKLYNGLHTFRQKLEALRGVQRRASAPQLQQGSAPPPLSPTTSVPAIGQPARPTLRASPANDPRAALPQVGATGAAPNARPYSHMGGPPRTLSLPANSLAPMQHARNLHYSPDQPPGSMAAQPPLPVSQATPLTWLEPVVQRAPTYQPLPNSRASKPITSPSIPISSASGSVPSALPPAIATTSEEPDLPWEEFDFDELVALDRSEWQADASTSGNQENTDHRSIPGDRSATTLDSVPITTQPAAGPLGPLASTSGNAPSLDQAASHEQGPPANVQPLAAPPIVPKVEADSNSRLLRSPPLTERHEKSPRALERRSSLLVADVIDIDQLSDDEPVPDSLLPRGPPASKATSSTPPEDVINIQDSDEEMEVDELDPSEPPESTRQSTQAEENSLESPNQRSPLKEKTPQPSIPSEQPSSVSAQQLINDINALSPEVRAQIRQKAKEPMILYYLSIEPSLTRDAAEEKFHEMTDEAVFSLYVQMESARRIIDHFKNMLAQSSHKLHLPHIDIHEMPLEPPTLLCSSAGTSRLATDTVEFSISINTMACVERWRARFATPAGSHGGLMSVELACYPEDAFYPSEVGGRRELTPNAQTRTWPDGGILWAFVNSEDKEKDRKVRLFLSPPPFAEPTQPVDISDFIQQGRNTIKFVHLGGMEHFTFVVQTRRMPPPHTAWPGVLKRVQSLNPNSGYTGLINRLTAMLEEK